MKKIYLFLFICLLSHSSFAQVAANQGFENAGSLPAGWSALVVSGTYNWITVGSGTLPSCSPHGGSYMMEYQSYNQSSGGYAILVSPVVDWSTRSGAATTVKIWYYRDCSAYNTSSYGLEGVTAYVNTTNSLSGSPISMGFVPRAGSQPISGGVTGTSTTTTTGWYQYTFTVPTSYNSSINYLIFKIYSQDGDNQYMDDVSYTTYPCPNSAIAGYTVPVCSGSTINLTDATPGGAWTSSNTAVATIGSSSGIVTSTTAGTSVISYTASCGTVVTTTVSVLALPSSITGTPTVCQGSSTALSSSPTGGTWSRSNASASVGSLSGIVTGVSSGTPSITYTSSNGCLVTALLTVNALPGSISGATTFCGSQTTTLNATPTGGTWSSSNPSAAVAGSPTSGVITGISSGGTASISYTLPTGCFSSTIVSVNQLAPITGVSATCIAATTTLGNTVSGGIWTSSNTAIATVGSSTGVLTGLAPGSVDISYTMPVTGCATTVSKTITNTPTTYSVTGGGVFCPGGTGVHVGLGNSNTGFNYQLSKSGVLTGVILPGTGSPLDFGPLTATGTYAVVGNPGTTCATNMTGTAAVTNYALPTVYNLTGGGSYCSGGSGVSVGLANSASGIYYQLSSAGTFIGAPVAGTGTSFSFGVESIAGSYQVVATNPVTGCSVNMSGSATVNINPSPGAFPVTGGGAFCSGGTGVHIGLGGSSTGVNYQLRLGSVPTGAILAGTGSALDFGLITTAGSYSVFATNTATSCTGTMTGSVVVTVNPPPTVFNVSGGGSFCLGGTGVHIILSNSQIGTNYFLYNGSALTGAGSGTGTAIDFGLQTGGGTYSAIGTQSSTACTGNMSGTPVVIVNSISTYTVSGGGAYCAGSAAPHVLLSASNTGINYQLLKNGSPVGTAVSGTGAAIDFGARTAAGSYSVNATNALTGCSVTMVGSAVITINPLPSGYSVTGGGAYCAGGTGLHTGVANSDNGISYSLNIGGSPTGALMNGNGSPLDFGLQTAGGSYTVIATNTTTSCTSNMPGSVSVVVGPTPNTYPVTGGGNYCAGGPGKHIGLSNSTPGIYYQLYNGTAAAGSALAGSGAVLDFGLKTVAGIYTVIARNPATTCTNVMTGSATIVITPSPAPFLVTGGGSVCASGTSVDIALANSTTGVNYQLFNGSTASGTSIAGTGSAIDFGLRTIAGTYTVVATNPATSCTSSMSGSRSVILNPSPVVHTVTGGGSYCIGGSGVNVGLNGSNAGTNYQLYNGTTLAGAPIAGTGVALNFGIQSASGIYSVVAISATSGCTANMTGSALVTISTHPTTYTVAGGGGYCPGGSGVLIGLSNSDSGVYYQLYNGSFTGAVVSGTGSPIDFGLHTIPGNYTVVATGSSTSCTGNMAGSVSVFVSPLPSVYNITGGGAYCTGTVAGVAIGLNGSNTGITYQIYNGGVVTGAAMAGTGAALNFGLMPAGAYTIVATSGSACHNNMDGVASVVAHLLPATQTVTGGGSYCSGGAGVSVSLEGSTAGIAYQLMRAGIPVGSSRDGNGFPINFGLQTTAGIYSVKARSYSTTCTNTMTGTVTVTPETLPTVFNVTGGGTYCLSGAGLGISLSGSISGTNYQLYNGLVTTGVPMAGTGSPINFGLQTATGTYTVIATNSTTTCTNQMTASATIATHTLPDIYSVTGGGNYCAGAAGVHILLTGSNTGITYNLYNGTTATGISRAGNGTSLDFGITTNDGTYTVIATNNATGCNTPMNGSANVTMEPLPDMYAIAASGTSYCAGGSGITLGLSGSGTGVDYQLLRGGLLAGSVGGTNAPLSFGSQAVAGVYTVVAINESTGCSRLMAGNSTVAINPLPAIKTLTGGGGYCTGGNGTHIGLNSSDAGVTYQLYHDATAVGGLVYGSGTAVDFGLQTLAGNYTVIATNTTTGCARSMGSNATVYLHALQAAFTVSGGGNFCAGGNGINVSLTGSATGTDYQLMNGSALIGSPTTGSGSLIDFGRQLLPGNYTVVATDPLTGCSHNMSGAAAVIVNPLPADHAITGGGNYCSGGTGMHIGTTGSDAGFNYSLYNGATLVGSPIIGTGFNIDFGLQTVPGSYKVIARDEATSCIGYMTGIAAISVNPLPDQYPVTGGGNYCAGTSGVHIGLASSSSGTNYALFYGGSATSTLAGSGAPLDFGLQTEPGFYTIKATNSATGCQVQMPGNTNVAITPQVVPSVTILSVTGDTTCAGSLSTYSSVSVNGGTAPVIQWSVNGVLKGSAPAYTFAPADGDNLTVTITSNAACAIPASAVAEMPITVLDKESPVVDISANPGTEVCRGSAIEFTALPDFGGTSPSYVWKKNGAIQGVGPTFACTPSNGDVVTCELSSNYRCRNANNSVSSPVDLIVDSPGVLSVAIAKYPAVPVPLGETETLTATVTNGGLAPTFHWYVNGTLIPAAVYPSFSSYNFANGDVVTCEVRSSSSCNPATWLGNTTITFSNVGVSRVTGSLENIKLSPNPNNGTFLLKGNTGNLDEDVKLEITNILGQLIYAGNTKAPNGELNATVQLNNSIANGMYLLNIRSGSANKLLHIVIGR